MRALAILAAPICLLPVLALGQPACGSRAKTLADLDRQYGERPIARGVTDNGCILEITASPSGTWTSLVTCPGMPQGTLCWGSSGTAWEFMAPEPASPGREALQ